VVKSRKFPIRVTHRSDPLRIMASRRRRWGWRRQRSLIGFPCRQLCNVERTFRRVGCGESWNSATKCDPRHNFLAIPGQIRVQIAIGGISRDISRDTHQSPSSTQR
jgi:hypothetical protein